MVLKCVKSTLDDIPHEPSMLFFNAESVTSLELSK